VPTIKFVNEKKEVQVPEGANLRAAARSAGVEIYKGLEKYGNCRGLGVCGTCKVLITKGMENASPRGFRERTRMRMSMAYIGNEDTMRLSCQTKVLGDMEVVTQPALNLYGENFFS
jgi:ferredoxin